MTGQDSKAQKSVEIYQGLRQPLVDEQQIQMRRVLHRKGFRKPPQLQVLLATLAIHTYILVKYHHENNALIVKFSLNYLNIDKCEKIKCHQVSGNKDTIHSHSIAYIKNSSGT